MFPVFVIESTGVVLIALLWIGVNRYLLLPISIFAIILLFPPIIVGYFNLDMKMYNAWWAVAGTGLAVTYFFRLRKKSPRRTIDYFKFSAVIIYALYLIPDETNIWPIVSVMYVCDVYTYDRLIIRSAEVNRRYVAALIVQTSLIGLMLVYALVQRTTALRNEKLAKQNANQVMEIQRMAEEAQHLAQQQEQLARKALEECQSKK